MPKRVAAALLAALALASPTLADRHTVILPEPSLDRAALVPQRAAVALAETPWPGRVVRFEIPRGSAVSSVRIDVRRERALGLVTPPPTPDSPLSVGPEASREGGYALWPLPSGDYRGHRIGAVLLVPYRSDAEGVHTLTEFDLVVTTAAASDASLAREVTHPRTRDEDARALRFLLDAEPLPAAPLRAQPPELSVDPVEYVIVTTTQLAPAFQELADIKTAEGLPAIVTTTDWILANYEGGDLPARVRSYLRDLYQYRGLRFALLGADHEDIPVRHVVNTFAGTGTALATDKYYACLDGSWNSDGDDAFGEVSTDEADLYPEITVSRVPASTPADAAVFMAKWKSYTGYDAANFRTDYQHKVLALAEVLFPDDWDPNEDPPSQITFDGAGIAEFALSHLPPSMTPTRMYEYSANPLYPTAVPEIRDSVIAHINRGYGVIDHVGHGYRTTMSVGSGTLVNKDADGFTNMNAYSLLYATNCTSGAVQFDCIVEHLMTNPHGGIVGGVASTDLDFPATGEDFKYEFFDLVFGAATRTTLGEAFHGSDVPFIPLSLLSDNGFRWMYMTLIALGDPAMEIWRASPDTLDLAFAPTMEVGDGTFTVTVTDDGVPVPDVRVTLQKSDGYGVATTDGAGVAVVDFLPETAGPFDITAVVNSYVPAQASATVNGATTAALRVDALTFHDGTAGGGTGNGDNRPDAGESIVVDVTLRNEGSATATGITTTWHATNPFLTVTDSTAASANIPASSMGTILGAYAFSVSAALPDSLRHVVVSAATDLACNEGSWSEETPFSVYQRILDVIALDYSIDGDDGDGVLETGETAEILLTLTNRGEATAEAVVGVGSYTGGLFTFLDDTINFGAVAPGALVQGGPLRLLSTGGGAADVSVDFAGSDVHASGILSRSLDVIPPTPPDSIAVDPGATAIRLSWAPIADTRGYRVYRAASEGGPYAEITTDISETGSFYTDEGLDPFTAFWYRVASVDSSGNVGALSDSVAASTAAPFLEGWPVDLGGGYTKNSPTFSDLDSNADYEVLAGWSYPMVYRPNGGDFVDGDSAAVTSGIFADLEFGNSQFWASPAVADLDGDTVPEIVFAAWQTGGGAAHLYVLDATGAIEPGWPQDIGRQPWATPAVGDVDNDGDLEIFVPSGASAGQFQGVLFGFHHDGTEVRDGDANGTTNGVFYKSVSSVATYLYGSVAMADIDEDDNDEIIYLEKTSHPIPTASTLYVFNGNGSIRPGFPITGLKGSTSSPLVADVDNNGDLEIVAVTENQILVKNGDGSNASGWPQALPAIPPGSSDVRDFMSSPAVGDVNGDLSLDIVLGWLDANVYVWTGNSGALHPGFPVQLIPNGPEFDRYLHSPILGNVDGDPKPEIILGSGNAKLFAVNDDATIVPGFPLILNGIVWGSPAIWDIDGDGFVNLIVQTDAPELDVFDFYNVPFDPTEHPWPMFRHDARKSGFFERDILIDVEDTSAPSVTSARIGAAYPNPFLPRVSLPFDVPAGGGAVRIRVFDVSGREVRSLADGRFPEGAFRISWDGRTREGTRLAPGVYFARIQVGDATSMQKLVMVR